MSETFKLETHVVDALLPDLVGHDQRPAAFLVYLYLWRQSAAYPAAGTRISHGRLAQAIGLSRSTVQAALEHLAERQLITTKRSSPTSVPLHVVQRPWDRAKKKNGE